LDIKLKRHIFVAKFEKPAVSLSVFRVVFFERFTYNKEGQHCQVKRETLIDEEHGIDTDIKLYKR
jgi:hypothetical protein